MDRKNVILIVMAVVLAAVLGFKLFDGSTTAPSGPSAYTPAPAKTPLTATLASVSGTVTVTHGTSTSPAVVGQELVAGDTVQTGADGHASLEFFASDRVGVDANTKLVVTGAFVDPSNWRKQIVRVKVDAGRVWSRSLRLLDLDSVYEVTSQNVIMTVRGTAFMVTAGAQRVVIDQFADQLAVTGSVTGVLEPGFSANFNPTTSPSTLQEVVKPTLDEVRNDHWVRAQLRLDEDFAKRAAEIRRQNGSDDVAGGIGFEAGPFTMDEAGFTHSGYHAVKITSKTGSNAVALGGALALKADAMFQAAAAETSQDVTSKAAWQVSNSEIATIDKDGILHASADHGGFVNIVARWNDGTHEHSGTIQVIVGSEPTMQIDTQTQILINGKPLQ
ncbi:MAG TPA: FecR domain-containing protein [Candidatus Methylomirabilis sp.]|nr:FecR domain-containing protein [Candidatus Methylomirabilis sp.]